MTKFPLTLIHRRSVWSNDWKLEQLILFSISLNFFFWIHELELTRKYLFWNQLLMKTNECTNVVRSVVLRMLCNTAVLLVHTKLSSKQPMKGMSFKLTKAHGPVPSVTTRSLCVASTCDCQTSARKVPSNV